MVAKKAGLSRSLALCGMTVAMPRALAASRLALVGVAFVADDCAGLNVGADIEQDVEMTRVGGFAAGQVEGDDVAGGVRFCVDFVVRPPRERPSACPSSPPL